MRPSRGKREKITERNGKARGLRSFMPLYVDARSLTRYELNCSLLRFSEWKAMKSDTVSLFTFTFNRDELKVKNSIR